jgi:hypothetical protein
VKPHMAEKAVRAAILHLPAVADPPRSMARPAAKAIKMTK